MKSKLIPSLALGCFAVYSAFAYSVFIQIKPGNMMGSDNVLVRSQEAGNNRLFFIAVLPVKNFAVTNWQGALEISDGTNHLVSCAVAGKILSSAYRKHEWNSAMEYEHYIAMTNRFSRSLDGAKVFRFSVATNLLSSSRFILSDRWMPDDNRWFYLQDFSREAQNLPWPRTRFERCVDAFK